MNPCKLKGQYLAQGRSGRRGGVNGFLQKLACCECKKPFLACGSEEPEFLRYKMKARAGEVSFASAGFEEQRKGETLVTPCDEAFRRLDSVGTRRFKRALKKKTQFTGCEPLEIALVKEGLVIHHQRDETNPFTEGGNDEVGPSMALSMTAFSSLKLGEQLSTLRDIYPDQKLLFDDEGAGASILAPELTLQNLAASRPADLQAVTLMKLFEEGAFNPYGEEVKATAYLLFKGLTQKSLIQAAFPKYPIKKFSALRKQVFEIYRENRTRDEVIFERFNRSLTTKQRKALELVYMGEERKSYAEAAKQLRISLDTLRNRIKGGVNKLKAAFPEYASLKRPKRATSNFKTDLAYDGFYRKSSAALTRPVQQFNWETNFMEPIDMEEFLRSRKQRRKRGATETR